MTPTRSSAYVSSSPSSTGSVPPHTPQSALNASPYGTPYLHQPSNIPISPSSALTITPHVLDEHFCSPIQQANTQRVLEIAQQYPHPFGAELVPQPDYKPHTQSDRRRYVEQVELDPPVLFEMQNSNGLRVGLGIPIEDAVRDRFMYLVGRDDPMFEGRGPSVSIRINWPGYPPWSRQIPTRDFRSPPQPVTRAKLARNVGKAIQRFFQDMVGRPMEDESQARWRVGPGHIVAEDLMLVGLQHVSMGSWQAHVRLIRKH
ncbi:hypothetical protein BD414DRAFT_424197 [Trametes punicea]|nr:hypothetical protein BD414DRAFT_424197 [Trametes punicea]